MFSFINSSKKHSQDQEKKPPVDVNDDMKYTGKKNIPNLELSKNDFLVTNNDFSIARELRYCYKDLSYIKENIQNYRKKKDERLKRKMDRFMPFEQNENHKNYVNRWISKSLNDVQFSVFLPCFMKLHIIKVNSIDFEHSSAEISVKIELNVKVPRGLENQTEFIQNIIQKMNITVLSQDVTTSIDFVQINEDTRKSQMIPNNIRRYKGGVQVWTQLRKYYQQENKAFNLHATQIKSLLLPLKSYKGILFVANRQIDVKLQNYSALAPFQMIDFIASFRIQPISIKWKSWGQQLRNLIVDQQDTTPISVKFNLLDTQIVMQNDVMNQINFEDNVELGAFDLAQKLLKAETSDYCLPDYVLQNRVCSWKWVQDKDFEDRVRKRVEMTYDEKTSRAPMVEGQDYLYGGDNYCHFHMPFYKKPVQSLCMIFVPLVVLGLINLFIFFQDPTALGDRIANIAALLISFVGMIVVIRDQILSETLTVVTFLNFLMLLTPLLCLIQSFYLNFYPDTFDPLSSFLFWICVALTAINFIYAVGMFIIFKCILQPGYNLQNLQVKVPVLPGNNKLININKIDAKNFKQIKRLNGPTLQESLRNYMYSYAIFVSNKVQKNEHYPKILNILQELENNDNWNNHMHRRINQGQSESSDFTWDQDDSYSQGADDEIDSQDQIIKKQPNGSASNLMRQK